MVEYHPAAEYRIVPDIEGQVQMTNVPRADHIQIGDATYYQLGPGP